MAVPSRERIELGKRRLRSVLKTQVLCSLRTLENKISDAGPTNQRIDPHILTIAKKLLMDEGAIKTYPAEPKKNEIQWYYLNGVSEEDLIKRYQELEPIHRATVDPHFTKRMGQTMEIAVSRALQGRSDLYSTGHYSDLNDHPDDKAYSKDEPPSLVGNLAIPGKKKLDFEIFTEKAGVIGIEENPRQRGRQRGLRSAGQYSLGKWMTLLAKYSVISSSGKSVYSIFLVNTILSLPSSHVSVALRSGCTVSFHT
jgi:hypothetical protein